MQSSDVKQRKKTSDAKQNGEKRRPEENDEEESRKSKNAVKTTQKSFDVKLILSLMCLTLSVIMMWWVSEWVHTHTGLKQHSQSGFI